MSTRATYSPGSWVAISTPSAWLLVDLPPEHATVLRSWSLLSSDVDIDAVLEAVVAGGIVSAPDFALARITKEQKRVVVRGRGRAVVDGKSIEARGRISWTDVEVDEVHDLELIGGGTRHTVELPLASGVTMACSIDVALDQPDRPSATPVRSDPPEAITFATPDSEPVSVPKPRPEPTPKPAVEPEPAQLAQDAEAEPPSDSYDFLFGATQNPNLLPGRASADASPVVPDIDHDLEQPVHEETATWATQSGVAAPASTPIQSVAATPTHSSGSDAAPPGSGAGGLIDFVPGMAPAPPIPPEPLPSTPAAPSVPEISLPVTEPASDEASISERTINRAALIAASAAAAANGTPIAGPTVLAGICPSGHLSPVHAAECRVCGAAMPMQDGTEIPRPPLGLLRLSTGGVVMLDRGTVFGRAPEVADDLEERPNAVRLASPGNDISRSHAEIELDGWHVYVTDLGSMNGTVVTLRGQQPVRLRPHDPQLLEHGAEVSLADEVSFVFEVTG